MSIRERYDRWFVDHEVAWELTMAALSIAFVVVGIVSESVPEVDALPYVMVELGLTVVFMLEFFTRIAASYDRVGYIRGHWIDLLALIPTIRGFRLFRLVRLLRLFRAFAGLYRALSSIERFATHKGLVALFIAWLSIAMICSAAFFFAESGVNPNINDPLDAFWWGIVTLSTVGYGDVFPVTADGRLAAAALMILGITLWAAITGTITSALVTTGATGSATPAARLRELDGLHRDGIITSDEFATRRATLMEQL